MIPCGDELVASLSGESFCKVRLGAADVEPPERLEIVVVVDQPHRYIAKTPAARTRFSSPYGATAVVCSVDEFRYRGNDHVKLMMMMIFFTCSADISSAESLQLPRGGRMREIEQMVMQRPEAIQPRTYL